MATRRQILLGAAAFVAAPYFARLERLAEPLEAYFTIPAATETITMTATAYFRVGDVLRIAETGENVIVRGVHEDTFTITRGVAA